jgi:hypothetical protein
MANLHSQKDKPDLENEGSDIESRESANEMLGVAGMTPRGNLLAKGLVGKSSADKGEGRRSQ